MDENKTSFKLFTVVLLILAIGCEKNSAPVIHQPLTLRKKADQVVAAQNLLV